MSDHIPTTCKEGRHEHLQDCRCVDCWQRDDRIEATVDAMALELERIGEGQRFVARVLSERSTPEQARMSAPPRSITPH